MDDFAKANRTLSSWKNLESKDEITRQDAIHVLEAMIEGMETSDWMIDVFPMKCLYEKDT